MVLFQKHYYSFIVLKLLNSASILSLAYERSLKSHTLLFCFLLNLLVSHKVYNWIRFVILWVYICSEILFRVFCSICPITAECVSSIKGSIRRFFEWRKTIFFHLGLLLIDRTKRIIVFAVFTHVLIIKVVIASIIKIWVFKLVSRSTKNSDFFIVVVSWSCLL